VFASDSNALGSNTTPAGFKSPDYELFTMNADGSNVRQLTSNELDDDDPAWSPDGTRVVFQRDLDPLRGPDHLDYDILTMTISGAGERNLTHNPGRDSAANWSPNGRRIAFDSERGGREGRPEIYTMNPNGSHVRRLTHNATFDGQPNWSPNGRKISFQSFREGKLAIYTMRRDGSDQTPVTDDVPEAFGSAWSPNGRIIAHSSFSERDIFTIDLHGSGERNLTKESPAFDFAPDWQPLPRKGH
jgi:TolB protein